jgi:hypothetical protein
MTNGINSLGLMTNGINSLGKMTNGHYCHLPLWDIIARVLLNTGPCVFSILLHQDINLLGQMAKNKNKGICYIWDI